MALCGVRIVAEQNYHHRPPSTVADFINAMMDGLKRTLLHFSMVTTWHARFFTHVYRYTYLLTYLLTYLFDGSFMLYAVLDQGEAGMGE